MTATPAEVARSIQDATTLDSLGWRLRLPAFRAARTLALVLLFCGTGVAAAIAADWVRTALPGVGAEGAAIAAVAIGVYIVVLHAVRETLTARRVQLTAHPLGEFFAAVDIPRRTVVVAEFRDRLATIGALACGICWGVGARAVAADQPTAEIITVMSMPAAVVAGALAVTASIAAWPGASRRPRWLLALGAGAASGGALALAVRGASSIAPGESDADAGVFWAIGASAVLLTAAASAVVSAVALRALGRSDFTAAQHAADAEATTSIAKRPGPLRWVRVVLSDLSPFSRATALSRLLFFTWAGGAAAVGLQLMTIGPAGWRAPEVAVERLTGVLAFLVSITFAELMTRWIGPTALAARWRASWEAGAGSTALAAAPASVAFVAGSVLVAPIAVAAGSFGADVGIAFAVMWSVLACSWIAAAIVPGEPPRADGSSAPSLSAGVFCVITSAAMTVSILAVSAVGLAWMGVAASVLVQGGAVWVTRRRILALPSRPLV